MSLQTTSARDRLRLVGQGDLGKHIEVSTGKKLWTIQRRIAKAVSVPRARVTAPSCNASGKTHLAGRIALAFYDAFTPGSPCYICKGPCRGSKIITTSSKWEHLHDNLWGELRMAYPNMVDRVGFNGRLLPGDLRLDDGPDHFIMGQSADKAEGFQGYHAAHKLIIGDEATALSEPVAQGITSLLASGDSRLLLIFNPTTPDTYAARMSRSAGFENIKITAWDTPNFTGEEVPEGANLISQRFLDELEAQGMGPGTYEWTTRVCADFWDMADDALIALPWVQSAYDRQSVEGTRALGVDMATYGTNENVITYRDGNEIVWQRIYPAMRMDTFWQGPVADAVRMVEPHYVIYDADGVGAGVIGEAEAVSHRMVRWGGACIPFRGNMGVETRFRNNRSMWWWNLRRNFEAGRISLRFRDSKLEEQLTSIRYTVTQTGDIQVETKETMKKRNMASPDRADSLMYACAMCDDLPMTEARKPNVAERAYGVKDMSEKAMWARSMHQLDVGEGGQRKVWELNPVTGVPDDW